MTRVLVAGATGYLGRFVAREFKERGHWVRVLARNPDRLKTPGPFLEPAIADLVDDVFVGELTRPATLRGLCDGIEVVFSSIGITRQTDRVSYMEVDYQGNRNLLDLALAATVGKFVFVHGFNARLLLSLEGMRAKQRLVEELQKSGLAHAVVCPTGFFNDMSEFLRMAKKGTAYLIGEGRRKINPIHGADLAKVCVDAVTGPRTEIAVGGPVTYTYREIAELAFAVLGKPPRVRRVPVWLVQAALALVRLWSKRYYTIAAGIATIMRHDFVAPPCGTHPLKPFFEEMAGSLER
jgi:uncharacterized protein YbjT (DUF2867 family)